MEYATDARVINETTPLIQISNRNIQIYFDKATISFIFNIHATFVIIMTYLFTNTVMLL